MQKHLVMIADENPLFRRGLRALIAPERDLEVVSEVANPQEIVARLTERPVSILVVNAEQVAVDLDFAAQLRTVCPALSIVSLGSLETASLPNPSAGSRTHHLTRHPAPAKLLQTIRDAAALDQLSTRQSLDLQALAAQANTPAAQADALTQREREVIRLLAQGMTVREAAGELGLSAKTVEAHTLNLMRKLNMHDRASVIEYAVAHGYSQTRPELLSATVRQ